MAVACPFCGSSVEPAVDAQGRKVCPTCNNTGRPVAAGPAPTWADPAASTFSQWPAAPSGAGGYVGIAGPPQNAPGATASLVLGIVSFFISIFGFVTAIIAIVMGSRGKRAIAASGGQLRGAGMANAGFILGWVYIGLASIIVLAAIVFSFVSVAGALAVAPSHS